MDILTANDKQACYPPSFYAENTVFPEKRLEAMGDLECDVCVIGAGYTGLSSALHLAEKGYKVVVLDAHRVGWGASGRNGGHVGNGQRVGQSNLEKIVGDNLAHTLWDMGLESVDLVCSLVKQHGISCDLRHGIIHACHKQRLVSHSHRDAENLQKKYGYDQIETLDKDRIRSIVSSKAYYGGTLNTGSAHLDPLAYVLGLAKAAERAGATIHENSRVTKVDEGDPARVRTALASITAKFVVVATNGYHGDLFATLSNNVMPINNYIVATQPLSQQFADQLINGEYAVADSKFVINYFRISEDRRLIFGGGESYGYRFPRNIASKVSKQMLEVYPRLAGTRIDYAWGGTLGITMNRLPYVVRIGGNILSAAGYSGHGVATATLAGSILAEAIDGQATRFDVLSQIPARKFPGGITFRHPLLVLAMFWYSLRDRF